jgi:hypothetical protein
MKRYGFTERSQFVPDHSQRLHGVRFPVEPLVTVYGTIELLDFSISRQLHNSYIYLAASSTPRSRNTFASSIHSDCDEVPLVCVHPLLVM